MNIKQARNEFRAAQQLAAAGSTSEGYIHQHDIPISDIDMPLPTRKISESP
jgi:hypothetical protein